MGNYSTCPIIDGLSDHDAQSITLLSFNQRPPPKKCMLIRKMSEHSINDFLKLSCESWDTIFSTDDVNTRKMFNSFLDSYLKIFYSSFPLKRIHVNNNNNNKIKRITLGILTSCKHKRELFIASRNSNYSDLINYYKKYCKILSAVIKEAKKLNYADKIKKSFNKNKTIWDTVNLETNKTDNTERTDHLYLDGNTISDCQEIANAFNKYSLNIAKSINSKQNEPSSHKTENITPLHYLMQSFKNPFPNINLKSTSTRETENIIKSLKPKYSSGYDGLSTKLVKIRSPFISSPLAHICNKSQSSGIFPDCLK